VVRFLSGRLREFASVKEERAENLAISISTIDELGGGESVNRTWVQARLIRSL
jgi:hypothetical protein